MNSPLILETEVTNKRRATVDVASANIESDNVFVPRTMRRCELINLKWQNIDFHNRTVDISKSKTAAGERVTPLNDEALSVLVQLYNRSGTFGVVEPFHYVFASFKTYGKFENKKLLGTYAEGFNPLTPVKGGRTAWRKLTREAGLHGLSFHDVRHHAITELAEYGASEQTILSIAGHISRRMLERYSHIRTDAKREALKGFSGRKPAGYGTSHGTNPKVLMRNPDFGRKNGRH